MILYDKNLKEQLQKLKYSEKQTISSTRVIRSNLLKTVAGRKSIKGVFAFVFTFDTILPAVKPDYIKNISTFADFLLKLVLVAAIASTISSVVGYRITVAIEREQADKNKRIVTINRIQKYSLYDLAALVFVSVIILKETVITILEYPYLVIYPVIIIVGLGWGLLSQIVYYQIIYRSRRRNI